MSAATTAIEPESPGMPRLLAGMRADGGALSLDAHLRHHGPLPERGLELIAVIERAGLTGRGGASFPAARKLEAVSGRSRPVLVANGMEGEPASGKDKVLLTYAPHLVLDGVVLAARAVGARKAIVATSSKTADATIARALGERRDRGISIRQVIGPSRFVSGEETALVHFLNGGPALPTFTPPRPFERGIDGAPTLVQNVETLAHIALIARHGADWFRERGTRAEPGSALVTISGAVRNAGVYEIPLGLPLGDLVRQAGGETGDLQAFLIGGYFGTWISAADAASARLADADLAPFRASLGARAIVALPLSVCGVTETARVARYLANESAGQCGPCVHGLAAVADDLEHVAHGKRIDDVKLRRRLSVITGRGACRHPDGAVRFVASALEVFGGEVERHLRGHRCHRRSAVLPVREGRR